MNDIASKTTGDSLTAIDFNALNEEGENAVTDTDQTLDPAGTAAGDKNMLGKAMAGYSSAGWAYTDSGSANSHVVSQANNLQDPTKYFDNMVVAYVPANTNTIAAVTVNVAGLGVKQIRRVGGTPVDVGSINPLQALILKYNDTAGYFEIISGSLGAGLGSIRDLVRNLTIVAGSTPDEQIDVDADEVMLQDTNGLSNRISGLNITIDNTVSGALGLFTGSVAASTWYFVWIVSGSSGVTGGLHLSTDLATVLGDAPAGNNTYGALVGAIRTDGTSDFISITQKNNTVVFDAVESIKDGSFSTSAWTAQSVTSIFPTIAKEIKMAFGSTSNALALSPRSDGHSGEYFKIASPAGTQDFSGVLTTARNAFVTMQIKYVGTIYYWTTVAASTLDGLGWSY
jgi:hypothetical protein